MTTGNAVDITTLITNDLTEFDPEKSLGAGTILNNAPARSVLTSSDAPAPKWSNPMDNGELLIGSDFASSNPGLITSTGLDVVTGPGSLQLNVNGETNAPFIALRRVNAQPIASSISTTVVWDDVHFTPRGFSGSSPQSTIVFPEGGIYDISYSAVFEPGSAGIRVFWITVASSNYVASERIALEEVPLNSSNGFTAISSAAKINVSSGDSMRLIVFQDSGIAKDLGSNDPTKYCRLEALKVSSEIV